MANSRRTADAVIIGGGIIGLSTAYHLAKRGVSDIVLLEKELLAQGSTGLSVGGVRQQFSHPANILLSRESIEVFKRFQEDFGVDIGFCQAGYLFLAANQGTWKDFLASVETQRRLGVPVETLCPRGVKERWPYLRVDDICGGTFCGEDGYADPYLAAMGFALASRRLGVRIHELTPVTGIRFEGGAVSGVSTPHGPIGSPIVVNVAGPWAAEVGKLAEVSLPVYPVRRQAFVTRPFDALPRPVPMVIDQDAGFYFRGAAPGLILGMSDPEEPPSFNLHTDREFMERVVEAAVHRAPVLENARILRGWAGLYEMTPDHNPIIGPVPDRRGLYCAVGFSGHGFQQGPAVGNLLSQLIVEGRTDLDLAPFAVDRFGAGGDGERRVV